MSPIDAANIIAAQASRAGLRRQQVRDRGKKPEECDNRDFS